MKYIILLLLLITLQGAAQTFPGKATDICPLLIGEKAPGIVLSDANGKPDSLFIIFSKKPTVLIFYRGGWCPYCNVHLAELKGIAEEVVKLGYQIIAISPDSPENLNSSIDKHKLNYRLLSDSDMTGAQGFGVAYSVPEASKERLRNSSGGLNPGLLPVPSVFILNQHGEIVFEYINPDYKKRLKGSFLLAVLRELN